MMTFACSTLAETNCQAGWTAYAGNCYGVFNASVTYAQAQSACQKTTGADLVSVLNNVEADFVTVSCTLSAVGALMYTHSFACALTEKFPQRIHVQFSFPLGGTDTSISVFSSSQTLMRCEGQERKKKGKKARINDHRSGALHLGSHDILNRILHACI